MDRRSVGVGSASCTDALPKQGMQRTLVASPAIGFVRRLAEHVANVWVQDQGPEQQEGVEQRQPEPIDIGGNATRDVETVQAVADRVEVPPEQALPPVAVLQDGTPQVGDEIRPFSRVSLEPGPFVVGDASASRPWVAIIARSSAALERWRK